MVVLAIVSILAGCVSTVEKEGGGSRIQLVRVEALEEAANLGSFQPAEIVSNPGPRAAANHLKQMPQGFSGEVLLEVEVLHDGSVGSVRVIQSLDEIFDRESIKAVRTWLFHPTTSPAGETVKSWIRLPVRFQRS